MKDKSKLRDSSMACALLFATSPVWAGGTKTGQPQQPPSNQPPTPIKQNLGGKCQSGFFHFKKLELDEAGQEKLITQKKVITSCPVPKVKLKKPAPKRKDILSLAFDPKKNQPFKLQFETSCLPVEEGGYVLVLLSSRCLVTPPQVDTPKSRKKLMLDKRDAQILGSYNVPAIEKKSGKGSSANVQMNFEVNLDTKLFAQQLRTGNDTFYLQGALLKKADFDKKKFEGAILSPLEAIHVTPNACPDPVKFVDDFNSKNEACKKLPK